MFAFGSSMKQILLHKFLTLTHELHLERSHINNARPITINWTGLQSAGTEALTKPDDHVTFPDKTFYTDTCHTLVSL